MRQTAVDRDAVQPGDTITWARLNRTLDPLEGVVQYTTQAGVHITCAGRGYLIEWRRVLTHTPQ